MMEAEERPVADRIDGISIPEECRRIYSHEDVLKRLTASFISGKMHHAWLLNGPRGVGKATVALSFAKFMFSNLDRTNAVQGFSMESISDAVHGQVTGGGHPELLHLTRPWDSKTGKFKTQLSVEEVRRTQAFYGMTAAAGGWRITIVDAADDMNASASNALLKILEEPPKRSLFFVLNHSTGRLLPTIRSRCQSLNFTPLSSQQIVECTTYLNVQASDSDRQKAADLSQGSVRRAVQLIQGNALKDYSTFEKLMQDRATGSASQWGLVHKIADSLTRKGQEDSFKMFLDLVIGWIGMQVRVDPRAHGPSSLAGWADVWDKANRSIKVADAFNLDRKQVVLSLFRDLFERNQRP